jgi:LysM repeat protein
MNAKAERGCGAVQPQTPTKAEKTFVIVDKEPTSERIFSLSSIENGGEGRGEEAPSYLPDIGWVKTLVPWQQVRRSRRICQLLRHSVHSAGKKFGFAHSPGEQLPSFNLELAPQPSYFQIMKRIALMLLLATGLNGGVFHARAQDAATDERLKKLRYDLEALQEANVNLQKLVASLDAEVKRMRDDSAQAGKYATMEELNRLAESVKDLDRKREDDKRLFVEKFDEIKKIIVSAPATSGTRTRPAAKSVESEPKSAAGADSATASGLDRGVEHIVEKGQNLIEIIEAYNKDLKEKGRTGKVTLSQVKAANPGLDPNRMKIGQKIFIPIPDK